MQELVLHYQQLLTGI